ncbi:MAG: VTT domain-containing protein [Gemmatirosa sp.]|nr:VTT domain-containing protein [Gemmatirosa sp.]
MTPLQELWAYVTLGASSIVTEELAPLVGGVAASQGELGLKRVMFALALGSWLATAILYVLGWWRGRWVRRRWPSVGRYMKRALRAVRRRPWRSALAVRFAFGARLLLPLACGAAHLSLFTYLVGTAVSSIVWAVLFTEIGYLFGEAAVSALKRMEHYDQYVAAVAIGVAIVVWLMIRGRHQRRVANAPPGPDGAAETSEFETPPRPRNDGAVR